MPSSPLVTISERSDPVTGLWLQQLFGALHSPIFLADPRAQERIFERTLWSLSNIDSDSADHAVLGARALSYLGRRASALRLLDRASTSPESTALSKLLRKRGFRFVGPTTVHAAMQLCGVVNDHLASCYVRAAVERELAAVTRPGS